MTLHGYFRSTASWRVRIALNLKGLSAAQAFHHLRRDEHNAPDYLALNPQGLLPALVLGDGAVLTQSLAICEYLDELAPEPPLLPGGPVRRAQIRAVAQAIACDIHPVQNLKILSRLRGFGVAEPQVMDWAKTTIEEGLSACEALVAREPGPFCFGPAPTLADLCLVPQLHNARRFGAAPYLPRLGEAAEACAALAAFRDARPEAQPDAE